MNNLVESKALVHTAASYYRGRASYSTDQRLFAALFEQVLGGCSVGRSSAAAWERWEARWGVLSISF